MRNVNSVALAAAILVAVSSVFYALGVSAQPEKKEVAAKEYRLGILQVKGFSEAVAYRELNRKIAREVADGWAVVQVIDIDRGVVDWRGESTFSYHCLWVRPARD